jgi:hypothetical protein
MRCPSCGTDNEPDSRFCGGCGARLSGVEPRVAPTVKVLDDAPFPAPQPAQGFQASIPPTSRAASIPPTSPRRALTPPPRPATAPPALSNPPAMSDPALSIPVRAHRPWGLIAIILVIDLGLAGTGGLLLAKGLSKKPAAAPPPPPPPAAPSPPPSPSPSPPPEPTPPADAAAAASPPADANAAAKRAPDPKKTHVPEDPYAPDLANEVDLAASRSAPAFEHCQKEAIAASDGQLHGDIKIAFHVLPDGHVTHAQAVQNTTGSPQLASCLVSAIVRWSFAVHPAKSTQFVRPFSY